MKRRFGLAEDVLPAKAVSDTELKHSPTAGSPDVDITMLAWNRPDETIEAIASALAQTGVRRHVFVVDQGSEPENLARLKAYCAGRSDVTLKCLDHNVGVAEGRNIAIALGSAPIIVGMDNDAVFPDGTTIERAVRRLREDPLLGVIAFRILDFDTKAEDHWDYPLALRNGAIESFEATRFLGGGQAIRRDVFEAVGGYDGALFFIGEERDIAWRIINAGYRIKWFRDIAILHHEHAGQKVTWTRRRYYFTVRNTLYINFKFGMPPLRLLRATVAFLVRGARNGLIGAAIEGTYASVGMMRRFAQTSTNKAAYRLSDDVRRYIRATDQEATRSFVDRIRGLFTRLPG
ncbi:MAG: glycosyltransferase family 2 protein [Alphaproteobacteria bacterium]|nr:glycosyltransferase family 2 protein [Alphaproteobacteria bacterium]